MVEQLIFSHLLALVKMVTILHELGFHFSRVQCSSKLTHVIIDSLETITLHPFFPFRENSEKHTGPIAPPWGVPEYRYTSKLAAKWD